MNSLFQLIHGTNAFYLLIFFSEQVYLKSKQVLPKKLCRKEIVRYQNKVAYVFCSPNPLRRVNRESEYQALTELLQGVSHESMIRKIREFVEGYHHERGIGFGF